VHANGAKRPHVVTDRHTLTTHCLFTIVRCHFGVANSLAAELVAVYEPGPTGSPRSLRFR